MLAFGTDYEYFNAVWVKNEWSRFLKLMAADRTKHLIPCYKGIDAYDMPREFAKLQAQDLGKVGAMQDLLRGIEKMLPKSDLAASVVQNCVVVTSGNTNTEALLKRVFMFLEDGDWKAADEYCERVLDIDPECAGAYLGKLLSELRVHNQEALKYCNTHFVSNKNYQKVVRFGNGELIAELQKYLDNINARKEQAWLDGIYNQARIAMNTAKTEGEYKKAAQEFGTISSYRDAGAMRQKCLEYAENARKTTIYASASSKKNSGMIPALESAIQEFTYLSGWEDADEQRAQCIEILKKQRFAEEAARLKAERISKRNRKISSLS